MKDNMTALKQGRLMYVCEATLDYLISILVASSFFATLTKELGLSDSLTGILSSIISLGRLFQLLSIFYRRQKKKNFVIVLSFINQIMFMSLYVIPLAGGGKQFKIVIFIVAIFMAYLPVNNEYKKSFTVCGASGRIVEMTRKIELVSRRRKSNEKNILFFTERGNASWSDCVWWERVRIAHNIKII